MKLYLAYGANLNREEMAWRCPQAQPVQGVELEDWQLDFRRHATITPKSGARLVGGIWRITEECEQSLDRFEGWPTYYRKETLEVAGRTVMVYRMNHHLPATPSAGYLKCLAQGYQDWGFDLDLLWQAYERAEDEEMEIYNDRQLAMVV